MADEISIDEFLKGTPVSSGSDEVSMKEFMKGTIVPEKTVEAPLVGPKEAYTKKNKYKGSLTDKFNEAIEGQGGFGLSPETRETLGAHDIRGPLDVLTGIPANLADVAYRGYQGATAAGEVGANVLDGLAENSGLSDALSLNGNKFLPGSGIMAWLESMPGIEGGLLGAIKPGEGKGFRTPEGDGFAPITREALNKQADELFQKGATKDQMNAWAKENGMSEFGPDLDQYITLRDAKTKTALTDNIQAPENKPEPMPVDPNSHTAFVDQLNEKNDPKALAGEDVVKKVTDALNAAGKVRPEQEALYTAERKKRLAMAQQNLEVGGAEGAKGALSALKGELPQPDFEGIQGKLEQPDVDALFNNIGQSDKLHGYEKINAITGLQKLFDGHLPAPAEVEKLSRVFGDDFVKAALKHKSKGNKLMELASNVINLPRSIVSTVDASIPLRQGVFMISRPEFYTSFGKMVKQMGSQKYFDATQELIHERPTFQLMEDSGLAIHRKNSMESRPEQFRSDWAGKIPVFKHLYKVSERGAEGFSNQLRADVFDKIVKQYKDAGVDLWDDPDLAKKVAGYINSATGRGKVPFNKVGTLVGDIFFSPQLMKSRLDLLNPVTYFEKDPILRKNKLRDLIGFSSVAMTVLGLAKLAGADVETNPLSSDWGKVKIDAKKGAAGVAGTLPAIFGTGVQTYGGKTRYDALGGFGQYIHLGAVLAMNERINAKGNKVEFGKGYKAETRGDTIMRFLRSMESPAAAIATDYLQGSDYMGNKFDLQKELIKNMIPFSLQDAYTGYDPSGTEKAPTMKEFKQGTKIDETANEVSIDEFLKGTPVDDNK